MYNVCSCFDFLLPQSNEEIIIIPPIDKTFITGLAYAYDLTFPSQLTNIIDPQAYYDHINRLNHLIQDFWPCNCAEFILGYGCCLCKKTILYYYCFEGSAGVSLLIPYICLTDAEAAAEREIKFMNEDIFLKEGIKISLVKKRPLSYLEIRLPQRIIRRQKINGEESDEKLKKINKIMREGADGEKEKLEENGTDINQLI